ncbi:hypothetical protein C6497_11675 [Candidatus Poribacteria bacterium]|nr:MAG: hypothetical protein C6497_11675 [Candidatus Poribacteria bacterium]
MIVGCHLYDMNKIIIRIILLSIFLIIIEIPAYSQFADLPHDAKTLDLGIAGDDALQTITLTAVVPFKTINGWAGVFGSRGSGKEGVITEIAKGRIQGGMRIRTYGVEVFTDLERNITQGTALTVQIGGYIRPGIYEKGVLRISGGLGYFLENIQPYKDLTVRKFDPTSFRWLAFSSIGWRKLNISMKFTPQVGFQNFQYLAEPALTFNLTTRLGLRLSGSISYNSEPLTEKLHHKYLTIFRFKL